MLHEDEPRQRAGRPTRAETTERYDVYLHNLPVVRDGKSVPIEPHRTREFAALEEARQFAAEHRDAFDRVVVMRTADGTQTMIERYIDGEHVVPEEKHADAGEAGEADDEGEAGA